MIESSKDFAKSPKSLVLKRKTTKKRKVITTWKQQEGEEKKQDKVIKEEWHGGDIWFTVEEASGRKVQLALEIENEYEKVIRSYIQKNGLKKMKVYETENDGEEKRKEKDIM
jgi:hypothetical protein